MVCLDSDFLIAYLRKDAAAAKKLQELSDRQESIHVTIINAFELYKGVYKGRNTSDELASTDKFLDSFFMLMFDRESAKKTGAINDKLKSNPIGDRDVFIASIAIVNKQTLLTRNLGHFTRVPDLAIETW